jgi:hypothetical protein
MAVAMEAVAMAAMAMAVKVQDRCKKIEINSKATPPH